MDIYFQLQFDFNNPEQVATFLCDHEIEHSRIAGAVLQLTGKDVVAIPIGTFGVFKSWLLDHQHIHQCIYDALGAGTAPDISELDVNKPADVKAWQEAHQDLHKAISGVIGV